jgi:hypothetical protein
MAGGFIMKRLPVVEHLTPEEIDRRYRSCTDAAGQSDGWRTSADLTAGRYRQPRQADFGGTR